MRKKRGSSGHGYLDKHAPFSDEIANKRFSPFRQKQSPFLAAAVGEGLQQQRVVARAGLGSNLVKNGRADKQAAKEIPGM